MEDRDVVVTFSQSAGCWIREQCDVIGLTPRLVLHMHNSASLDGMSLFLGRRRTCFVSGPYHGALGFHCAAYFSFLSRKRCASCHFAKMRLFRPESYRLLLSWGGRWLTSTLRGVLGVLKMHL